MVELYALRTHPKPFGNERVLQPVGRHVAQERLFNGYVGETENRIQPVMRFHEFVIEFVFSILSVAEQINERDVKRDNLGRDGDASFAALRRSWRALGRHDFISIPAGGQPMASPLRR